MKKVTELRNKPSKTLLQFSDDLDKFVDDKGLRNTYETYKLPSKNKPNGAVNGVKAEDLKKSIKSVIKLGPQKFLIWIMN